MTGFEPATPWSQIKCTTKLCYIPSTNIKLNGAPCRNRTHNLLIRSQTLYPVELWARISLFLSTTLCYYNRVRVDLQQLFLFFHSLIFRIGGDDGTRTRTMFPSPDFKSDASTDSATSPILWRYLPDLNWRSQSCSLLPYHLATEPYRVLIPTSPASVLTNLLLWYYITFWKKCKLFFKFFLFFLQKVFWCVYISFKNYF